MGKTPYIFRIMEEFLGCNERDGRKIEDYVEILLANIARNVDKYERKDDFVKLMETLNNPNRLKSKEVESMILLTELATLDAVENLTPESKNRWEKMMTIAQSEVYQLELTEEAN